MYRLAKFNAYEKTFRALEVHVVGQDLMAWLVARELKVQKAWRVLLGNEELVDKMDTRDQQDLRENRAHQGYLELRVCSLVIWLV